jgi:hypothetical protein
MLEFFRKHQRIFLIFVAVIIIFSFSFFGTYSAITSFAPEKEIVVGKAIDGSKLTYSDITHLGELLGLEKRESSLFGDLFLKTGIASRLEAAYFEKLKGEWQVRLDRAKRARFYVHPHAPFLNARDLWTRLSVDAMKEIDQLQKKEEVTADFFASWSRLYSLQEKLPGELIKRIIFYQQNQLKIPPDPHLALEDFSLFGYRTVEEWFGRDFLQLAAQFVLNVSLAAEKEGFKVSKKEAEADLQKRFDLSRMNLNRNDAIRLWQKALSFAHYFESVGQAVLVDPLSYRKVADFALETVVMDLYRLPRELQLKNLDDLLVFETYVKLTCPKMKDPLSLPTSHLSVEEVLLTAPQLLYTKIALRYAEVDTRKMAARSTIRDVWNWQTSQEGWKKVRGAFPTISDAKEVDARFQLLEKLEPQKRALVDDWTRRQIALLHPEWIESEFEKAELKDVEWILLNDSIEGQELKRPLLLRELLDLAMQGDEQAKSRLHHYQEEGESLVRRIESPKVVEGLSILSLRDAKEKGRIEVESRDNEEVVREQFSDLFRAMSKDKKPLEFYALHRFQSAMRAALSSLQKGEDSPLEFGLWKIEKSEQKITRNSDTWPVTVEESMMQHSFKLNMGNWSQLHIPTNGDIVFFFVKEHQTPETPILERIQLGKTELAAEAERELADRLLEIVQAKQAMTTPVRIKEASHDDL